MIKSMDMQEKLPVETTTYATNNYQFDPCRNSSTHLKTRTVSFPFTTPKLLANNIMENLHMAHTKCLTVAPESKCSYEDFQANS